MKRIEYVDMEEFKKLYKAEKDKKMKLLYLLAFGSGLRISEIIGLKSEESNCCRAEVQVKRIAEEGKTLKHYFCGKCKKEIRRQDIRRGSGWKIPPLTVDKINLKTHQIRIDMAKGGKWRSTVTPPNLTESMLKILPIKIPRRTVQYRFEKLSIRTLNKKLSIHILRHGFGNYQANIAKVPLPIVQQLMGHSRLDTTGIYTKANPEFAIMESWKAMTGEK